MLYTFQSLNSLNYKQNLALLMIIQKKLPYRDKLKKTLLLKEKNIIAASKQKTRDACFIYKRKNSANCRLNLSRLTKWSRLTKSRKNVFTLEKGYDFTILFAALYSQVIVIHLFSTARAEMIAETFLNLSFNEIVKIQSQAVQIQKFQRVLSFKYCN